LPRWIGVLVALKGLVLAEYRIEFHGLSVALVGALVLAKVALVLELGASIRTRPTLVDVVLRTALYAVGVLVGLVLEKPLEARHAHGGLGPP
jgi:drug/metabolite transporter (DMT)-like permease